MRDLLTPLENSEEKADRFKWSLDLTVFPSNIYIIESFTLFLCCFHWIYHQAGGDGSQLIRVHYKNAVK